jgi:hypothetical protein
VGLFYSIHLQVIKHNVVREISDPYHSLLLPSGGVSLLVWGVIYTALAIFCLYHIKMAFTHHEKYPANQDTRRVDMFFVINNLAATGWILTTVNGQLVASLILLAFQLLLLAVLHNQLNIYKRYRRLKSTVCTQGPLSIYAAWLSLLFIAGVSEYFNLHTESWQLILMGTLIIVSLLIIFIRHNILFALMIIPGLYGIVSNVDAMGVEDPKTIALAAWGGIWALAIAAFIKLVIDFRLKEPPVVYHRVR